LKAEDKYARLMMMVEEPIVEPISMDMSDLGDDDRSDGSGEMLKDPKDR